MYIYRIFLCDSIKVDRTIFFTLRWGKQKGNMGLFGSKEIRMASR